MRRTARCARRTRAPRHLLTCSGADADVKEADPDSSPGRRLRERIADAEAGSPAAKALNTEIETAFEQCLQALEESFEERRLDDAAAETNKLRYLWRMRVALEELS